MNQKIIEQLRWGKKTQSQLKDALGCSYKQLQDALNQLIAAEEITTDWTNDELPCIVYVLPCKHLPWLSI